MSFARSFKGVNYIFRLVITLANSLDPDQNHKWLHFVVA